MVGETELQLLVYLIFGWWFANCGRAKSCRTMRHLLLASGGWSLRSFWYISCSATVGLSCDGSACSQKIVVPAADHHSVSIVFSGGIPALGSAWGSPTSTHCPYRLRTEPVFNYMWRLDPDACRFDSGEEKKDRFRNATFWRSFKSWVPIFRALRLLRGVSNHLTTVSLTIRSYAM